MNENALLSAQMRQLVLEYKQKYQNTTPVSESFLRVGQELKNNKSSYNFSLQNTSVTNPQDVGLAITDTFICVAFSFQIRPVVIAKAGVEQHYSYPNLTAFPAAAGFTPTDLQAVFNAKASIRINQSVIFEKLEAGRSRYVPETQQTAATDFDEQSSSDGWSLIQPRIIFAGDNTNSINLELPIVNGIEIESVDPLIKHEVVCNLRGVIIPNVTLRDQGM